VVKDFHFNSLHEAIKPLVIFPQTDRFSRITVRIDASNTQPAIRWIENTWKKHFPSALLDYNFLDSQVGEQYATDNRFQRLFLYFSFLSLLIGCLGLFGLVSYTASQRTKEIGIRKVLGAKVSGIALLLSKDFLKLVVLAFIVATPVTWYIMNNWLGDFAYRIKITWWMFGFAGVLVIAVALITVSFQSIKAAIANPIKSLRTE
jgi:putative ABC transport system permease protein